MVFSGLGGSRTYRVDVARVMRGTIEKFPLARMIDWGIHICMLLVREGEPCEFGHETTSTELAETNIA